jgi:hypothetical protein
MERLIGCQKAGTCNDYRPRFDALAWLLMFAVFLVLAVMFNKVDHLEKRADLATGERADIRAINDKQTKALEALTRLTMHQTQILEAKLIKTPADVYPHVIEIERMLKENHKMLRAQDGDWRIKVGQ